MPIRGKVKNGKVLLNNPKAFADGTEVEVRPVTKRKAAAKPRKPKAKARRQTFAERYASSIGAVKDLPSDMSVNHDHYLYGVPKQE
jgi:hypothetical protein